MKAMCSPNDSRNGISSAEVSDQIIVCHMNGEDSVRRFQHPNDEVRIDTLTVRQSTYITQATTPRKN